MGNPPSPPVVIPPPPRSSLAMLYYGLVVAGTAAAVLVLYNLVVVRWCSQIDDYRSPERTRRRPAAASSWRLCSSNISFISGFKYKRDEEKDGGGDYECAVCLSVFEEGEELKRLPNCRHCFHATCIDMWLYSHMDCPLCRSGVEPPGLQRQPEEAPPVEQRQVVVEQPEHSREVLLGPSVFV